MAILIKCNADKVPSDGLLTVRCKKHKDAQLIIGTEVFVWFSEEPRKEIPRGRGLTHEGVIRSVDQSRDLPEIEVQISNRKVRPLFQMFHLGELVKVDQAAFGLYKEFDGYRHERIWPLNDTETLLLRSKFIE